MLTRRKFVHTVGMGAAGALTASYIGARGREDALWSLSTPLEASGAAQAQTMIPLSSNENPLGPGQVVLQAIQDAFGPQGATPGRYSNATGALRDALSGHLGVTPENLTLGCGSTQILRTATHVYTERTRALVGTIPTYEECAGYAAMLGRPVRAVSLNRNFQMDLDELADASRGAGLVFYCNPNNPVATYTGAQATRDFIARVHRISPDTRILVDEAYFDYVTHPDHESMIPLALEDPRVIVARTFSKAYGMAGLRLGYAVAHPDAIRTLSAWDSGSGTSSLNVLALHAGVAAIGQGTAFTDAERARNKAVRDFTVKWFADRGMRSTESHTNFIFTNTGMPARQFRDGCLAKGVRVGRDFPPFQNEWCRISLGTMEEMTKAVAVFGEVLGKVAVAAA
ncbi:MAG: histidinol-phosphate aminotransferase family protein [Acidobacteria bacterium]|jgi:histidinol-phosphate aminotransferase|nr:histidinol-phosphate aminotransferase family protein [Acidobacteriota bacterium]